MSAVNLTTSAATVVPLSLRGPAPTASVKKLTPMPMKRPRARSASCSFLSSAYPASSMARRIVRG